jgi:hypothetical protein
MRKHISFTIAATIAGLAVVFWAIAGGVDTKADIVLPKVELSSSISHPYLPAQVLAPVFHWSAVGDRLAQDHAAVPRRERSLPRCGLASTFIIGHYNGSIDDVWGDTARASVAAYLKAPRWNVTGARNRGWSLTHKDLFLEQARSAVSKDGCWVGLACGRPSRRAHAVNLAQTA